MVYCESLMKRAEAAMEKQALGGVMPGPLGGQMNRADLAQLLRAYSYGIDPRMLAGLGGMMGGGMGGYNLDGMGGFNLGARMMGSPPLNEQLPASKQANDNAGVGTNIAPSVLDEAGSGEGGATSLADASGTSLSGPAPISPMTGPAGAAGGPIPGPTPSATPMNAVPGMANMPSPAMNLMTPPGNMGIGGNIMGKLGSAKASAIAAGQLAARIAYKKR